MKRGRPKGSGRWSDDADARVWARMTVIMERDSRHTVSSAADKLADEGFFQVRGGRYYSSTLKVPVWIFGWIGRLRWAGKRMEDTGEVLRRRYHAAERKRDDDPAFREWSDERLEVARRQRPGVFRIEITR